MSDKELDKLYDAADLLMKDGQWGILDDLLTFYGLTAWRQDIDLLIGWATVTLPCKSQLKQREWFMEQCLTFHNDPKEPELWKGL